jgi:hypothetical protein
LYVVEIGDRLLVRLLVFHQFGARLSHVKRRPQAVGDLSVSRVMAQEYRLGRCRRRSQLLRGWTKNDLVDIDLGRLLDRVSDGARDRVRRDLLFVELKLQPRATLCRKSIISDSWGR